MKKQVQHNINYKGISALENALLSSISDNNLIVFGVSDLCKITGFDRVRVHNLLASLSKKNFIVNLLRNRYCLREVLVSQSFAVAVELFVPSYVSLWSALSFYGFTEQQVSVVQIISPKQVKGISIKELTIETVTVKPKRFFGYVKRDNFVIALKEKALIDSALNLESVGGFDEFVKCFVNAWNELNKRLFVKFLLMINDKSLNARIGFLIEKYSLPLSNSLLKTIHANSSKGFVKLNYLKPKTNQYNKKWKIIVNDSVQMERII